MHKAKNFNRQCDPTLSVLQPIADRVAKNLEITSETFNFVPGVPGFSWDLSLVPFLTLYQSKIVWAEFRFVEKKLH